MATVAVFEAATGDERAEADPFPRAARAAFSSLIRAVRSLLGSVTAASREISHLLGDHLGIFSHPIVAFLFQRFLLIEQ